MGSGIITLRDSNETIDIEHHFKVNAGPEQVQNYMAYQSHSKRGSAF